MARVERLGADYPSHARRLVHARSASRLVETLTPSTLLVVGAPEGSWIHRQLIGPGHSLAANAPAGAVIVRSSPTRCFHRMEDPVGHVLGASLTVADALRVRPAGDALVADQGRLMGIVRRSVLVSAASDAHVAELVETAPAVKAVEPLAAARELSGFYHEGPVPVVRDDERLVGVIPAADLGSPDGART